MEAQILEKSQGYLKALEPLIRAILKMPGSYKHKDIQKEENIYQNNNNNYKKNKNKNKNLIFKHRILVGVKQGFISNEYNYNQFLHIFDNLVNQNVIANIKMTVALKLQHGK